MNKTKGASQLAMSGPEWLIPAQIARDEKYKGVYCADAIRKKALAGEISYRRSGRKIFIHRDEIKKLLGREYPAKKR